MRLTGLALVFALTNGCAQDVVDAFDGDDDGDDHRALVGYWGVSLGSDGECAFGVSINEPKYRWFMGCETGSNSADVQTEEGECSVSDGTIWLSPKRASCSDARASSLEIVGANLALMLGAKRLVLEPVPPREGNDGTQGAVFRLGCYRESGFVEGAPVDLPAVR